MNTRETWFRPIFPSFVYEIFMKIEVGNPKLTRAHHHGRHQGVQTEQIRHSPGSPETGNPCGNGATATGCRVIKLVGGESLRSTVIGRSSAVPSHQNAIIGTGWPDGVPWEAGGEFEDGSRSPV